MVYQRLKYVQKLLCFYCFNCLIAFNCFGCVLCLKCILLRFNSAYFTLFYLCINFAFNALYCLKCILLISDAFYCIQMHLNCLKWCLALPMWRLFIHLIVWAWARSKTHTCMLPLKIVLPSAPMHSSCHSQLVCQCALSSAQALRF